MNYLAHVLLAGPAPEAVAGALLGDFARGLVLEDLPEGLRAGVLHHRRVDRRADAHPVARRSRRRLDPRFRHLRGIMVDLFYDHFLARHWSRYGTGEALPAFTARVYDALDQHRDHLTARLCAVLPRMRRQDWLGSYSRLGSVGQALRGIARRLSRPTLLGEGLHELRAHYGELQDDFHAFFPELRHDCPPPQRS